MTTQDYPGSHEAGGMSLWAREDDPKRLAFTAARYKHVAKMLAGKRQVLEVGCSDGYFSRIVAQHVGRLTAIDSDQLAIKEATANRSSKWPIKFIHADALTLSPGLQFDAIYGLDVFEHIPPPTAVEFIEKLSALAPVVIIGTPSLESQAYASAHSRQNHVNCMSGENLRNLLQTVFPHVFMFTMNDEGLGTGFLPMAHYLLALCVR